MPLTRDNVIYDSKYGDIPGLNDYFNKRIEYQGGIHSDSDGNRRSLAKQIDAAGDQFKNLFKNSVGRDPSDQEVEKYFAESGGQAILDPSTTSGQNLRNMTAQYIGDTFQPAAQETAQKKTEELTSKYSSLADQYMDMGKKSLGNLSDDLKTYSTSLFDKLRPQLNLAAQAGGYGDSGGQTLQEQGALTDLANQGRGTLANAAYDVENQANAIRYGGAAAPVSMASEYAAGSPYAVANLGAGGLGFNNQDYFNNQNYLQQLGMLGAQNKMFQENQPSFGRTLSQNFAKSFGDSAGTQATQYGKQALGSPFDYSKWFSPGK